MITPFQCPKNTVQYRGSVSAFAQDDDPGAIHTLVEEEPRVVVFQRHGTTS